MYHVKQGRHDGGGDEYGDALQVHSEAILLSNYVKLLSFTTFSLVRFLKVRAVARL